MDGYLKAIIEALCQGPERQIHESVKPKLLELIDMTSEARNIRLTEIIDECCFGSLCSDFVIYALISLQSYRDTQSIIREKT